MSLIDLLMNMGGKDAVSSLGERFGLDQSQTTAAMQQLVPALGAGLQRNLTSKDGAANLLNALTTGNHSTYVENPDLLQREETTASGNRILGHVLRSKVASRQVAAQASARTGIDVDLLQKMLPLVATMVMGALSKKAAEAGVTGAPEAPGQPLRFLELVTPLLGAGSSGLADAGLDMIGRYLRNR